MANVTVIVGGTTLPSGLVSLKRSDELLWSEGTGRAAGSGQMVGSVVAKKQTYTLEWGPLASSQYAIVRNAAGNGFVSLSITIDGAAFANCTVYRGKVDGELMGIYGGSAWYRGVVLELVER